MSLNRKYNALTYNMYITCLVTVACITVHTPLHPLLPLFPYYRYPPITPILLPVGRIGGDSGLSVHGFNYARKLAEFVEQEVTKDPNPGMESQLSTYQET